MKRILLLWGASALLIGCTGELASTDADAEEVRRRRRDSGQRVTAVDAGGAVVRPDAGASATVDAGGLGGRDAGGAIDAGTPGAGIDAGLAIDAGAVRGDAGLTGDAGPPRVDSGLSVDAGPPRVDAGFTVDAGPPRIDAGPPPPPGPSCGPGVRCLYVTPGGAGARDGSDWANALAGLPATLSRGATYMLAGGAYPTYTFNTPESGSLVVTLKKATPSDHGTDAGWMPSYGTTQAVFARRINVHKSYFVLDGQYRNEDDWFDGASYGFKIQSENNWTELVIRDAGGSRALTDITIRNLFIQAVLGLPTAGGVRVFTIDTDTYNSEVRHTNGLFSRIYIDGGNNPFMVRGFANPVVEYSASSRTCSNATYHGEVVNLFYTHRGGGVIRYNHFRGSYDGSAGCPAGSTGVIAIAETSGVDIYGNIFESFSGGNGAIAAPWSNSNIRVYNNTFYRSHTYTPMVDFPNADTGRTGTGNVAYNNLCVECERVIYRGLGTFGNNGVETADVFVDAAGGDFRLARRTSTTGMSLRAPFDRDFSGRPRGTDGAWDVGAFEFGP